MYENSLENVQLDGHFESIEFNLLLENSDKIPSWNHRKQAFIERWHYSRNRFFRYEFVLADINVNFYSTEGLVDTQNLGQFLMDKSSNNKHWNRFDRSKCQQHRTAIIRGRRWNRADIQEPTGIYFKLRYHRHHIWRAVEQFVEPDYFDNNQTSVIIDEANRLLDAQTLYTNPLDVFNDEDFLNQSRGYQRVLLPFFLPLSITSSFSFCQAQFSQHELFQGI